MADSRISQLELLTSIDVNADSIPIVDASEPDITKKTKRTYPNTLKTALALNNVQNTADLDKPVSNATQSALDGKQAALGFTPENVINKSTSVVTDFGSNTKYPSVKSVYDWATSVFQTALGFTAENVANKSISVSTDQASNTKYPSVKSVYDWATGLFATITQLNAKQDTLTGATTTVTTSNLTASRAVVSDGSGKIAIATTTSTEIGYVNGVTSSIQMQLDSKTSKLVTTNRQTASYTLVLSDADKLVEMNVASANNLTVPLNSSVAFSVGTQILLAQYGVGQTTIVATSGVTIRSNGGKLKLNVQYSGATLIKIATDEWYLFGDIA